MLHRLCWYKTKPAIKAQVMSVGAKSYLVGGSCCDELGIYHCLIGWSLR